MKRKLYRCPEDGCEAAFLDPLQLAGHKQVHADDAIQRVVSGP